MRQYEGIPNVGRIEDETIRDAIFRMDRFLRQLSSVVGALGPGQFGGGATGSGSFGGSTPMTEYSDGQAVSVPVGGVILGFDGSNVRAITTNAAGDLVVAGDVGILDQFDLTNSNPAAVAIVDGAGTQITSFGGGTQYTEGDTDASITGTAVMWEDTADTLRVASAAKPLPVNVISGGTAGAQYAEDTAHVSGDFGTMALTVRKDTGAAIAGTDGDYSPLQVDATGNLRVNVAAGGAGDGAILDGVSSSIKATVRDYTNANPLAVELADAAGDPITLPTAWSGSGLDGYGAFGSDGSTPRALRTNATGELTVNVASLPLEVYTDGDAIATPVGSVTFGHDGSNVRAITVDAAGDLQVDILSLPNEGQQTMANSISVAIASDQSTVPVSAASLPLPSGAATLAEQQTQTASLSVLDDWDETDRCKVNPIVGQAGVQGASGVVTALTQRVVLATDVALPAGTNGIGKLTSNSGVDIGDVDVLTCGTITPGTGATNLGKAEDGGHTTGDVGVLALGVRVDVPNAAASSTTADYQYHAQDMVGGIRTALYETDFAVLGTNHVKKYYTNAGAVTDGIVWSPAAGKRWYITDIFINVSAAATVTLEDDLAGGDSAVWKAELAANSGWSHTFTTPLFSGEDAADLLVTTTAGNIYIMVTGYEV